MIIEFADKKERLPRLLQRKKAAIQNENGEYITRFGEVITDPVVIEEYKRIAAIPRLYRSAVENARFANIRKNGDRAKGKNKFGAEKKEKKRVKKVSLSTINAKTRKAPDKLAACEKVIDLIYTGKNPIAAAQEAGISPKKFFSELEKPENKHLADSYKTARECYAEFLLYRRELLEQQLLKGEIDSSTYSAISNDIRFLAARCFPKAYGDKQIAETTVTHRAELSVDAAKIKELNNLLNAGSLPPPTIDADFTINQQHPNQDK